PELLITARRDRARDAPARLANRRGACAAVPADRLRAGFGLAARADGKIGLELGRAPLRDHARRTQHRAAGSLRHSGDRAIAVVAALPFALRAGRKLMWQPEVIKGMSHLGLPESLIMPLGVIELLCVVLYLVPKTSIFGAILFTGYVGGAIVTHLRMGEPVYLHIALGIVIWLGLYLRRPQLRQLFWAPRALSGSANPDFAH